MINTSTFASLAAQDERAARAVDRRSWKFVVATALAIALISAVLGRATFGFGEGAWDPQSEAEASFVGQ